MTDGWIEASISEKSQGESEGTFTALVICMTGRMTGLQIIAIVEKYMKEHPEEWHERMSLTTANAMVEACHLSPQKSEK